MIENGIDMPNVNTIIVLSANRFGMASLYQLRGRVGRSPRQAYAAFLTNSTSITVEAETRLQYLRVVISFLWHQFLLFTLRAVDLHRSWLGIRFILSGPGDAGLRLSIR